MLDVHSMGCESASPTLNQMVVGQLLHYLQETYYTSRRECKMGPFQLVFENA